MSLCTFSRHSQKFIEAASNILPSYASAPFLPVLFLGIWASLISLRKCSSLEAKLSASWHQTWGFFFVFFCFVFEWDWRKRNQGKCQGNVVYWDVKTLKVKMSKAGWRSSRFYLQYSQGLPWLHRMNSLPSALDFSTHRLPHFKLKKKKINTSPGYWTSLSVTPSFI